MARQLFLRMARRFAWAVIAVGLVALLIPALAITFVVTCLVVADVTGPSADAMRKKIEREVPERATLDQIHHWLATEGQDEGLEFGSTDDVYDIRRYSAYRDATYPSEAHVYSAILRGNPGLTIDFILDEDLRLIDIVVERYWVLP